jgi:nucleotide-binding universal stress UspA family protein
MKVLLTTDGSACAAHALQEAERLLPLREATVYVLGVTDTFTPRTIHEGAAEAVQALVDAELAAMDAHLEAVVADLAGRGIPATALSREGLPADVILEAARELGADLIVMGSHGRNALGRLVLGSVSDHVLHHHDGAVLVVRPESH